MANLFKIFCFNDNSWDLQAVRYHLFSLLCSFFLVLACYSCLKAGFQVCLPLLAMRDEHRPRQYDMIWQQFDLFSEFFLSFWMTVWADGVNGYCWCLLGGWGCWLSEHAPDPKCKLNISPFLNNSTSIRLPRLC